MNNRKFMEMYDLLYKYGRSDLYERCYYRTKLIKCLDKNWEIFRSFIPKYMDISTSKVFITRELLMHYENKFSKEDLDVMILKFSRYYRDEVGSALNTMIELRDNINVKICNILEKDLKDNDEKIKSMIIEYI